MTARSVVLTVPAVLLMAYGAYISIVGIIGLLRASSPVAIAGPTFNCFLFYILLVWLYQWLSRGLHKKLLNRVSIAVFVCICVPVVTALLTASTGKGR